METEGGSQLFESAEKGGVMKNGPLKGGGSCKCVRDHLEVTSTEEKGSSLFWTLLRREERNISSNLSRIVLMDKLQVISQIIFDGELMIFMTMTLGLRLGYLLIKLISS